MPYINKIAQQAAQHRNYLNHKGKYKASLVARIQRNRDFVTGFKANKKCSHCPENRAICLHFHHIKGHKQPGDKGVSELIRNGSSIQRITEEIAKCIILCANCHLVEHDGCVWDE